jgi:UDP-glucose 4-epimerase
MRILITGGAGFIGSHLAEVLVTEGHQVVVLDDFSTGDMTNLSGVIELKNFKLVEGNILNRRLVKRALKNVDYCFHYAAAVGVDLILKDPIGALRINVHGSENVMGLACDLGVPVIFASTSEIYGKNSSEVLDENADRIIGSPTIWRWSYSDAKALDESYATALASMKGFKVKTIRYFNTVGPRQSEFYGMVIPNFFKAAIRNQNLRVYGDGSQRRVFCHVDDAVNGTLSLWRQPDGFGEVFNLGGSDEISILELAQRIIDLTKSKSEIEFVSYETLRKSGYEDMTRRRPNIQKIALKAKWAPEKGIDRILSDYFDFLLNKKK